MCQAKQVLTSDRKEQILSCSAYLDNFLFYFLKYHFLLSIKESLRHIYLHTQIHNLLK
jgi:hypothetical protein